MHWDTRWLAAGNARRIDGGDPQAMAVSPPGPNHMTLRHPAGADLGITDGELAALEGAAVDRVLNPGRRFSPKAGTR